MFSNTILTMSILLTSGCAFATGCMGGKSNSTNNLNPNLPKYFPCQWLDGIIPFVFDFYSINSNRLIKIIRDGQELIQNQSCLTFNERNPISMAETRQTYFYLYYTYSNVLEACCSAPIESGFGRRVVLISPGCKEPHEIAHVTLHMLGLSHASRAGFPAAAVDAVLHLEDCQYRSDTRIPSSISVESDSDE